MAGGALTVTAPCGASQDKESTFFEVRVKENKNKKKPEATISVKGKSGFHCNTLYPWKLTMTDGKAEKKILKKQDAKKFEKDSVVFVVPYTAGSKVSVKLKFSVCNDKQCIMETVSLSIPQ